MDLESSVRSSRDIAGLIHPDSLYEIGYRSLVLLQPRTSQVGLYPGLPEGFPGTKIILFSRRGRGY